MQPHRRQPTRVCCPWDSPGKNTGVGCHFRLQCIHACKVASAISDSVWSYGQQPTRLLCPWDSSGKNTGVSCHFLLQHETRPGKGLDWKQINKTYFECSKFNEDMPKELLERESSNSTLHLERQGLIQEIWSVLHSQNPGQGISAVIIVGSLSFLLVLIIKY